MYIYIYRPTLFLKTFQITSTPNVVTFCYKWRFSVIYWFQNLYYIPYQRNRANFMTTWYFMLFTWKYPDDNDSHLENLILYPISASSVWCQIHVVRPIQFLTVVWTKRKRRKANTWVLRWSSYNKFHIILYINDDF